LILLDKSDFIWLYQFFFIRLVLMVDFSRLQGRFQIPDVRDLNQLDSLAKNNTTRDNMVAFGWAPKGRVRAIVRSRLSWDKAAILIMICLASRTVGFSGFYQRPQ